MSDKRNECRCVICGKSPADGVTVYRINEKGVPGLWACKKHLSQTDAPEPDPAVKTLVDILEGTKR